MKKVLAVLVLGFLGLSFPRGVSAQIVDTPQSRALTGPSVMRLKSLVLAHPEPLVREKLYKWVDNGTVKFAPSVQLQEMVTSVEVMNGKKQILIWYNLDFLFRVPDITNQADKESYLRLVLYHEAVHVEEHLNGRHVISSLVATGPVSNEYMANYIWDTEWPAVSKEWVFAKKMRIPHLVPMIAVATLRGDNPRNFLQGFYELQMSGNAIKANPKIGPGLTARYKLELAKLEKK
ncbi:MAG: hypothetical protein ABL917_03645 [Parcubacteria group bacterium]